MVFYTSYILYFCCFICNFAAVCVFFWLQLRLHVFQWSSACLFPLHYAYVLCCEQKQYQRQSILRHVSNATSQSIASVVVIPWSCKKIGFVCRHFVQIVEVFITVLTPTSWTFLSAEKFDCIQVFFTEFVSGPEPCCLYFVLFQPNSWPCSAAEFALFNLHAVFYVTVYLDCKQHITNQFVPFS